MPINSISNLAITPELAKTPLTSIEEGDGGKFANVLEKTMGEVNDLIKAADKASSEVAVGRSETLHEAMISMEKAETALKFLVTVRNKAVEAYHEIMRMQV